MKIKWLGNQPSHTAGISWGVSWIVKLLAKAPSFIRGELFNKHRNNEKGFGGLKQSLFLFSDVLSSIVTLQQRKSEATN